MWIILELFMDHVMVSYFPIKWFSKIDFRCGDMYTVTKVKKVQYRYVRNDIKNISRQQQQQSIQSGMGPFCSGAPCECSGHLSAKLACVDRSQTALRSKPRSVDPPSHQFGSIVLLLRNF